MSHDLIDSHFVGVGVVGQVRGLRGFWFLAALGLITNPEVLGQTGNGHNKIQEVIKVKEKKNWRLVLSQFKTYLRLRPKIGFRLVLPGWSAAGWPAGAPGCVGSVPVRCWGVLVSAAGHTRPGQCTATESLLGTEPAENRVRPDPAADPVQNNEKVSHRAGSAGRWCAGPEPLSAAPSRPSSQSPGCSSCRRRSRPAPADREQVK